MFQLTRNLPSLPLFLSNILEDASDIGTSLNKANGPMPLADLECMGLLKQPPGAKKRRLSQVLSVCRPCSELSLACHRPSELAYGHSLPDEPSLTQWFSVEFA